MLELGERAGVDIGEVYRVDASRRSTALNAYVGGLGPTKRVVLYDTLLERADRGGAALGRRPRARPRKHDDIPRGLAFVALVAPLGLLFAASLAEPWPALRRRRPRGRRRCRLALALAVASLILGVVGNQLSREVEASADTFALELTDDPEGLDPGAAPLAARNVADPDPPGIVTALLGTHPSTVERIGAAVAYRVEPGSR